MTAAPNAKILIIAAEKTAHARLSRWLEASGFVTIETGFDDDALHSVLSENPDLLLLDNPPPCAALVRQIKTDPRTLTIPIVELSKEDSAPETLKDVDSILAHPVEPAVLLATVKTLLRGRQIQRELLASEERFRAALKNAPIMIGTCDENLKYSWVYNAPAPLKTEDFLGKTDEQIFPPDEASELAKIKREALASRSGRRLVTALTLDRETRCFDMTVEPFVHEGSGTLALTIACIDVTERLQAEKARQRAVEEAEFARQSKARFLSNMSHEIRTPLGIIQGFADLALDSEIDESDRRDYLQTIKRNAEGLTQLLGEILDLSKIETGWMEIEKTRFSLRALLNDVMATLHPSAAEKNIALFLDFDDAVPEFVCTDATRLRQILVHLLSNSIKFTLHGAVRVQACVRSCAAENMPTFLAFQIRDSGIGLSEEQVSRLFQPFSQADSSTTRQFGGSGLGLDLSKKLARSLGGDLVLLESTIDQGSLFEFTFDAGVLSAADYARSTHEGSAANVHAELTQKLTDALRGLRALLVENSDDNRNLFSRYLHHAGAHVDLARNGDEGLELARDRHYDVILVDLQLPDSEAYRIASLLREQGFRGDLIALTAHARKEERERARREGFTNDLIKPISRIVLIETLSRLQKSPSAN